MKQYISDDAVNILRNLVKDFFHANSVADNVAYSLQAMNLVNTSKYYHETFAHFFTSEVDLLTERMNRLGARSTRKSYPGSEEMYENPAEAFEASLAMVEDLRKNILNAMELLDYDINNKEIILKLEDISVDVLEQLYRSAQWAEYARYYYEKGKTLEMDFKMYKVISAGEEAVEDDD